MPRTNSGISDLTPDLDIQGLVLDVDQFASHDGPGIRTAVFLKGCPLSCVWCHSPESQSVHPELLYQSERCNGCGLCPATCPEQALILTTAESTPGKETVDGISQIAVLDRDACTACGKCVEVCYPGALRIGGAPTTVGEILRQIEADAPFFTSSGGGVTLSGGEPARQAEFSYNFLLACQKSGVHTAMETTGYARTEVMQHLAGVTDLLLFDVKFVNSADHRKFAGVPNELIIHNLKTLANEGHTIQVRVPCIPGINDSVNQIRETTELVSEIGLKRISLLPYNSAAGAKYEWIGTPFELIGSETQNDNDMQTLADICSTAGLEVEIGG
ncbi:MAG: glycyl-radical enzyme activating protein [Dehalococcoidia bacterium]|nr:glycyl-radical enzyme activating protein [Dehalococcoidia bacterium]